MKDLFLCKLKHQAGLMYLGSAMREAIESGKLKGEKLKEAEKKSAVLLEASEFINELFYKYEQVAHELKSANYERVKLLGKLREQEGLKKELEAVKKAWEGI